LHILLDRGLMAKYMGGNNGKIYGREEGA